MCNDFVRDSIVRITRLCINLLVLCLVRTLINLRDFRESLHDDCGYRKNASSS